MAKSLYNIIRKYRIIIVVTIIVLFILLMILGYTMSPDETWKPSGSEQKTKPR